MKKWIKWKKDNNKFQNEGVNPTDIDSAGMDQDLSNTGVAFNGDEIDKLALVDRERYEIDREYQKKIWDLMKKSEINDDPNDIDPTLGPHGSTPHGIVDDKIKSYLQKKYEELDQWKNKSRLQREKIPVKTTSSYFIDDKKRLFSPRTDVNVQGNADRSNDVIDEE